MSKADVIEIEGTVVEKLPNAMFQVELELLGPLKKRIKTGAIIPLRPYAK